MTPTALPRKLSNGPVIGSFTLAGILFAGAAWFAQERPRAVPPAPTPVSGLAELHEPLPAPQPGDWLAEHHEPGQTFEQYVRHSPIRPDEQRDKLYIRPIGEFSDAEQRIVELCAEYMERYFQIQVVVLETLSDESIPDEARRVHPSWGVAQILTTHVLDEVLAPNLPDDAVACIAFTSSDLWPGDGWNFVFGQASLRERVGVWSIARNGDAEIAFELCLRRTLKTATHETGHMLSLRHCIAWHCNMNGSNSRQEADRQPLWACPECERKLCWSTGSDSVTRYEDLLSFCAATEGLEREATFFKRSIESLRASRVQDE